jgi:hypothetical protein
VPIASSSSRWTHGADGHVAAQRGRKPHQFHNNLMPGHRGEAVTDVRDAIIELLTAQGMKQVRVHGRHLTHHDVEIRVPATHLVDVGVHSRRA